MAAGDERSVKADTHTGRAQGTPEGELRTRRADDACASGEAREPGAPTSPSAAPGVGRPASATPGASSAPGAPAAACPRASAPGAPTPSEAAAPAVPDDPLPLPPDEQSLLGRLSGSERRADAERYNLTSAGRRHRMVEIFSILRRCGTFSGPMTPAKLRHILEELGPSFVKIGQILSMRSEILPRAYCEELAKLRADVEPLPFETVLSTLRKEYGRPLEELFAEIDRTPLGSASVAQVHRARLVDGSDVAVKVQRPGVQETMARDIDLMRVLARRVSRLVRSDQFIDFNQVVEELWVTFREETDFLVEARNLRDFHALNRACVFVDCPEPVMALCTEHVVVMQYVEGISIEHADALVEAGYDLEEIGTKLVDNFATQVLDDGFFHADPHPGNIIVSGGRIMYIDLGMVGRISGYNRSCLSDIIFAVGGKDSSALKDALLRFAVNKDAKGIDHASFLAELDQIVEQFGTQTLADLDLGSMLYSLIGLARKNHVELPSTVTMLARGLGTLEGVLDEFMPQANMIQIICDHIERSVSPADLARREARELAAGTRSAVRGHLRFESELGEMMHMLTRGQLKVNMEMLDSPEPIERLSRTVDRLTLGIIIAGLFIGSSVVYFAGIQPVIFGVPVLGFVGYVGAGVLSVYVIVQILRSKRPRG